MHRPVRYGFVVSLVAAATVVSELSAQSPDAGPERLALEVSLGVVSNPGALGHTSTVEPAGYFDLGGPDPAPVLELAVVLPPTLLGARPLGRISWAPGADVRTRWIPCDPGAVCPSILAVLAPGDARVSRLEAVVGVERDLPVALGPFVPGASVALGVRRYGLSWEGWGEPGPLQLPPGSHGETDLLVKGGLSAASSGPWALVTRVEAGLSRHGPGTVDASQATPDSPPTVDLGRQTLTEYTVSMAIRRRMR